MRQKQFDVEKLRHPRSKTALVHQLKNKFQALADAENHTPPDINTMWERVKTAYTQTSEDCLGYRHQQHVGAGQDSLHTDQ
ncbi:hypothetical protein BaRGS_00023218 [Batillaria attramentaria]|uniref:J domain-containing protein n=1 Tax=Batillaria attramentaria TaxID=370345 RepID=A0ABD0KEP6_9CAEN